MRMDALPPTFTVRVDTFRHLVPIVIEHRMMVLVLITPSFFWLMRVGKLDIPTGCMRNRATLIFPSAKHVSFSQPVV